MNDFTTRYPTRYQDEKKKENDKKKKEKDKTQQDMFDQLQKDHVELHVQLQQRKRSSSTISRIGSHNPSPSCCPICTLSSNTETVVTWKECGHTQLLMIPPASLSLLPQDK